MGKIGMYVIIVVVIAVLGIQFIPVDRTNPPVENEITAPAHVMNVIKTSCYDCHSNETNWLWYSYVAPSSWFVADHVAEGREHLNFSDWYSYEPKKQKKLMEEIWEEVEEGEMPLASYTFMHPKAALNDSQKIVIREWIKSSSSKVEN
ncbi:MAG: heme-binding domain-containing protein [Melioribacteraceae bacterium]|nr:heme-binding domain-containing protein [Melioribacteraceae bacterium]MCF8356322.1 heme-binding domain-containing protein [Melioribacteraceae bacterium]MCF8394364.1 heme-binding domain-containing protein [Melioribacteraceae bacterium]MCF8420074.1 heme-binding domain-containing protein [Melioribacteraceae bacterium]